HRGRRCGSRRNARPDPFPCRGNRPGEALWRTVRRAPERRSASTWWRRGREQPSARRSSWPDEAACYLYDGRALLTPEREQARKNRNDQKDDIFMPHVSHSLSILQARSLGNPPQRLLSISTCRANSSGPPLSGSMPCGRQVITTSFAATASRAARASLSMTSRG